MYGDRMSADDIIRIEKEFSSNVYPSRNIVVVKGKGAKVWDIAGREYIDCTAGYGVAVVGHCNDEVVQAINDQANRLITCSCIFYNDIRARLYEKLAELCKPLTKTFLSNSGTEAIECAIKIARRHTRKSKIIAFTKAFHGKTLGSLSATWEEKYKNPFLPLVPGFVHAKFNDIEDFKNKIDDDTAAVIIELIQGESGINISEKEFVKAVRDLCDSKNILLIIDEIQTGLGRTGKLFAYQHYGIVPDILCLAKGLAGGVPIGATIAKPEIFESLKQGEHSSTFGGNPLVCAAAIATLDFILKNDLPRRADEMGSYFIGKLRNIQSPIVREIRGMGLMIAIELKFEVKDYIKRALSDGVLLIAAGRNTLRLLPPLVITREEIDKVCNVLEKVLIS